ncbi:tetratricopeptide repeat protein 32-like [Argiope bruennichi]|uniref:Tetratricopeptide repeat protein 32 like protein n=1 Tax=Argiope bruennichi TaxID=94029 RepID=A0A8T0FCT9_ARGBR|nr:tetratricopeptide repeat protein 32-like [Argiope bruennichi]KAF8788142.1 Tetratricopeptide repeat protein 32 like protein [Argiope bruennichi]
MKDILVKFESGQKLMDVRKYDEAEKIFNEIIIDIEKMKTAHERKLWLSKIYNNLGFILYKKVEFNKAQELYRKSMTLNPSFAPAYYNHGVINYRLGLFESAVKDLRTAVLLEPQNSEFVTGLHESEVALNEIKKFVK